MKTKLFLLLSTSLLLTACGGGGGNNPSTPTSKNPTSSQQQSVKYTVTFANTSMPSVEIEAGKTLSKPADPSKANCLFVGWFLDAKFTQEANFPLVITQNTTIYANFYSYQDAFEKARDNTIGNQVVGYEYDYTLHISASYLGVAFNGNTTGNAKYNSKTTDISFYDSHVNSGSLFYDGSKYTMKKGRELHVVTLDQNDKINRYDIKEVGDDYKYDSSSFAKAVFEYDKGQLKEIKPTSKANEYELKTSFNFSKAISLVGNYVNHPIIETILGDLPETSVDTGMFVTFNGDELNTYRYEMEIDVNDIVFSLTYQLNFKNVGIAPTITPKVFNNVSVSSSDVAKAKNEIDTYLNAYKGLERSSYDYNVKTEVEFPKKNGIDATIKGFTKRKIVSGKSYYLNDYEVDTDLKNADLYESSRLDDFHGGRAKLSNGEVHDLKKKFLLSSYEDAGVVSNPTSDDDYYLMDVLEFIGGASFVEKLTETSKNKITFNVGASTSGTVKVLKKFNDLLRINKGLKEPSADPNPKAFGTISESSVDVKNFKFNIIILNGSLSEIILETNGKMTVNYPGSRDFSQNQSGTFKLSFSLKVTSDAAKFEPAESVDKI